VFRRQEHSFRETSVNTYGTRECRSQPTKVPLTTAMEEAAGEAQ
jgi:hypothetical protein